MIEVTESLRAELHCLAAQSEAPAPAVRIARDEQGLLGIVRDELRKDDVIVFAADQLPPLITSAELAEELDGAILHIRSTDDNQYGGAGLVLLQPRAGKPRPDWAPPSNVQQSPGIPWESAATLFRRRRVPASPTDGASL